ncbi:uncharacterized protein LOC141857369 [Brevipalpus obovatus]|uniref:uncharacterized protein LOC141857369 n=1 Tax=Brevipalpus obovatus TaxID=246614 RepID=UPI003D9DD20D
MYWNAYCLYTMMCFTSHIPQLDKGNGLCTFYQSEDVNRNSLVLDASKQEGKSRILENCITQSSFNTILIHASEGTIKPKPIFFSSPSLNYEHLIVLNWVMPLNLGTYSGKSEMVATSLTIYKNSDLIQWIWLKNTRFKYIRIDNCFMFRNDRERYGELFLSKHLLTLTLVNLHFFDPFTDLNYKLAPNLREL